MHRILFAGLTVLTFMVYPAHGWNALGHRTVAELVWRQMDARERQKASELLRQHPHYKSMLAADVPHGVDKDEWVFLTAAAWPDWVRPAKAGQRAKPDSVTKYNLYPHGIGYAYVRASDTNCAALGQFKIPQPDSAAVLSNSLVTLRNHNASPHDRAVSLCWVLHLYGDLHQPLHVANLCTPARPNGTSLGGTVIVRGADGERISLHAYWDGILGNEVSYRAVAGAADELTAAPELQRAALPELRSHRTIPTWVQEGYERAATLAYAEGRLDFADAGDVDSGKVPASAVPALKPEYMRDAHQMGQRCLALAAFRLGDALKGAW